MTSEDTWNADDVAELHRMGTALPENTSPRSPWATERVLQAARDGAVLLDEEPGLFDAEIQVEIDGRDAEAAEARALIDLTTNGYLAWAGRRVTCTTEGRDLLSRWAKYQRCTLINYRKDNAK